MRTIYAPFLELSAFHERAGWRVCQIWIQRHGFIAAEFHGVQLGQLVRPLTGWMPFGSAEMWLWREYAVRTARAWNALDLAAELLDLPATTSPLLLAEESDEAGYPQLARFLTDVFGLHEMRRNAANE